MEKISRHSQAIAANPRNDTRIQLNQQSLENR